MADYIKREDAERALAEQLMYEATTESEYASIDLKDYIEEAEELLADVPSADVEEVVHCKDCKWCKHYKQDEQDCYCCTHACGLYDVDRSEDDYCSYGERKEQEDE